MSESEQLFDEIVSDLEAGNLILPTLPDVALKVREVVDDVEASAADLANIIITDPALSAQLIRAVNSPLYRGRNPIENVQMAVSRLGRKLVKSLVNTLVMKQLFQPSSRLLQIHLQQLWEYSTEIAAASRVLAATQSNLNSEDAMLAGLVHKIGALPILMKAEKLPDLLSDVPTLHNLIDNLHPTVGRAILKAWEFPDAMLATVMGHQDLNRDSADGPDLVDVIQVSIIQNGATPDALLRDASLQDVPAFRKLGLDPGIRVVELDENSEAYADAMALFNL
ncbi:MAG: HDOD domain-containing protein [Halieaceae bacterium]|jgi:HD-like signal output (HDOD) protein|nr:HDOD domain-containing protein [Halieaceae bacterium]